MLKAAAHVYAEGIMNYLDSVMAYMNAETASYARHCKMSQPDTPNRTFVHMGQGKILAAATTEEKEISTSGLCGCIGAAAILELADRTRYVMLQHYPPTSIGEQAAKLGEFLAGAAFETAPPRQSLLMLVVPGEYGKPVAGRYELLPSEQEQGNIDYLSLCARCELLGIAIKVETYSVMLQSEEGDRTFAVRMLSDGTVSYSTWFSSGKLIQ
jgi:hypothetical protein